jgi:hypothetical protein
VVESVLVEVTARYPKLFDLPNGKSHNPKNPYATPGCNGLARRYRRLTALTGSCFIGRSLPERDIRRRYDRALANLPEAIKSAHQTAVYDNSSISHVKLIEISDGRIVFNALDETNGAHCQIADAVGSAMDIALQMIFKTANPA